VTQHEPERSGDAFIARFIEADELERDEMRTEGEALANDLSHQAMELGMSKATEFSPRISVCTSLAAKVALLSLGPDHERLDRYERAVRLYQNYPKTRRLAQEYERFRAEHVEPDGVVPLPAVDAESQQWWARDTVERDLDHFFDFQIDPEVDLRGLLSITAPLARDAYVRTWAKFLKKDGHIFKAILVDGTVAGVIYTREWGPHPELFCRFGRQFRGRGLVATAVATFLDAVKTRPLVARILETDVRLFRALQENGFVICEGDKRSPLGREQGRIELVCM